MIHRNIVGHIAWTIPTLVLLRLALTVGLDHDWLWAVFALPAAVTAQLAVVQLDRYFAWRHRPATPTPTPSQTPTET